MLKKKPQRQRNRRKPDAAIPPPPSLTTVSSVTASAGSQVTIEFADPVQISGSNLPSTWRFGTSNRTITALVSNTVISYVFTLSGTAPSGQAYSMPGMDPAARTPTGGYVATKNGTLA